MKIADFFIQITAKGDLKELKMIADAQKAIKEQSKMAVAAARVKVAELKKETEAIKVQAKLEAEKFKITKQEPLIKAKTLNEELKAKAKSMQIAKAEAKEEAKKPKTLKDILIARGKIFDQQSRQNILVAKGIAQTLLMGSAFASITMSVIGATLAVDKMVQKLAQANQLYTNFQRQTGISIARAMGVSAAMANLDVTMTPEEVMQNMQNLQSNLVGVQFGMGNIAPYQMAGINPWGANSADMLDVIRKQLRGFAPAYRTFLLQQMGLDPRLGALIDMSDKEYARMKAEQSFLYLDPQVRKDLQEIGKEVNKFFLILNKTKDLLIVILARFVKPITSFLTMALNTVNIILEGLAKVPAVLKTIEIIVVSIITILTRGLIWLIPILEDLAVWASGGKSLFKELFNNPKQAFGAIGEHAKSFFSGGESVNNTSNKNIAMNVENNIHVGSAEDGYKLVDPLRLAYNGAIAQYG